MVAIPLPPLPWRFEFFNSFYFLNPKQMRNFKLLADGSSFYATIAKELLTP
jgi:hypothetical protein